MESILTTIKKALGIDEAVTAFDSDIIMHINSVFMTLDQLGVGPVEGGFYITDDTVLWTDFLGESRQLEAVKSYMLFKVRLMFDPPSSSFVVSSMERQIEQLEWRLNVQVDYTPVVTEEEAVEEDPVWGD